MAGLKEHGKRLEAGLRADQARREKVLGRIASWEKLAAAQEKIRHDTLELIRALWDGCGEARTDLKRQLPQTFADWHERPEAFSWLAPEPRVSGWGWGVVAVLLAGMLLAVGTPPLQVLAGLAVVALYCLGLTALLRGVVWLLEALFWVLKASGLALLRAGEAFFRIVGGLFLMVWVALFWLPLCLTSIPAQAIAAGIAARMRKNWGV